MNYLERLDDGANIGRTGIVGSIIKSRGLNLGSIIKSRNKKPTNTENKQTKNCNFRKKEKYPLEGNCRSKDIIYKRVITATGHPQKVFLGIAQSDFKQRYYKNKKSFEIENKSKKSKIHK